MGKEQEKEVILEQMEERAVEEISTHDAEKSIEEKLVAVQEEIAGYQDKMLRAAAEFDNYKKRMERDRNAAMKYAGEHILREILPVVDNLERALNQGVVSGVDAEMKLAALLEGVQLTLKSLLAVLEKFEVKAIESVGLPFDPNIQEALVMEPSDVVPASHVLGEFEKGYYYKDRLLRVAKVIVSSGKAAS
ncbi:MAG: nucleotide exchange factor GrpE [Proteobacteria bacterium]|nr:nucleotide exchange factor GrpE [Desulfocapsa sp.]MBU3945278.1 nucleotide exchange factor GrpE [Pseudomonadota bacterium]MCG2742693.1 nucleotide exchange factor GrpE [Desulfobacteraceae bacterium]MDO8945613.1 nucleotide exchange factor GrpE [Desulfocapsaceae bacterium]MBU3984697.1 nucleotide exchange factor GrpE [Pseudomonadota bacterium]